MPDYFSRLDEVSIDQLLVEKVTMLTPTNEYNCFIVPDFQRRYAWDKTNWEKFWEDAEDHVINDENWFLGSMITLIGRKSSGTARYHEVIDGQQRLTTIFIFRIAIFDVLDKLEESVPAEWKSDIQIYKNKIKNIAGKDRLEHRNDIVSHNPVRTRLMQLYDFYVAKDVSVRPDRRTKYHDAFEFFRTKLNDTVAGTPTEKVTLVLKFYATLLNARMIWAQVETLQHAMSMFEVLNNRGKPLGITDIVKTTILQRWLDVVQKAEHKKDAVSVQRKTITESGELWQQVQKFIYSSGTSGSTQPDKYDDATLKRFSRHFYILYAPTVRRDRQYANLTERQMLKEFEDLMGYLRTPEDIDNLKEALQRYAAYYGFLRSPVRWSFDLSASDWFMRFLGRRSTTHQEHYISHLLSDIHTMGLVQINVLLLHVFDITFHEVENEADYRLRTTKLHEVMSTVTRFVVRRNITDTPRPNKMDGILAAILNESAKLRGTVIERLERISQLVQNEIDTSPDLLAGGLRKLRYDKSLNTDIRFFLHFIEKWQTSVNANGTRVLVLRSNDNPFDGFRIPNRQMEYQIEHIMPKSLLKYLESDDANFDPSDEDEQAEVSTQSSGVNPQKWLEDLVKWGSRVAAMDSDERTELIHSLGNLTLLTHNPQLSDMVLSEKQNMKDKHNIHIGYRAQSPVVLNELPVAEPINGESPTLKTTPQWTERQIAKRTEAMHALIDELLS